MFSFTAKFSQTQRRGAIRRHLPLSCGIVAATVIMGAGGAKGALILPASSSDVPVFNTTSVFDASRAGNNYSVDPGTTLAPGGFDIRDLFGGSFGTYG